MANLTHAVLAIAPADPVAKRTKAQLLIALDRFSEAVALLDEASPAGDVAGEPIALAKAYCLYKQGKEQQALDALEEGTWDEELERGVSALKAQTVRQERRILASRT